MGYVIHNATTGQTVTTNGQPLRTFLARTRGAMFRRTLADDLAFIFEYSDVNRRGVHMMFVFSPLDVVFLQKRQVEFKTTLTPWFGRASCPADTFIEFVAGGADGIRVGDRLDWGPA